MSTLVIKKDFYDQLDYGFDKSYEVIGDYDLVMRALKLTNILYIPEPLSFYRWHNENLSKTKFRLNILELLKWKKNLAKQNFFSFQNLMFLNDHLIYLIALYLKNKNKKIKIFLFLKKFFL